MNSDAENSRAVARGRVLLLVSAVLWSTNGVIVKSPPLAALPLEYRGPVLACYRALFAAACLLPFVQFRRVRFRWGLVPMALSFASMNVLFITALTRTTAAAAIYLQYTCTIWAFLFGLLFLHERISRANLVTLGFILCGIVWIVAGDWGGEKFLGNLLAAGSGLTYGAVIVSLRFLREEDSAWLVALNHATAGLVLLPWIASLGVSLQPVQWGLIAVLGCGQMALPYLLFAIALRTVTAQEAALIPLVEPILNPLWVWLLWGERVPASTWMGGVFILGGLALRYTVLRERTTL